MSSRNEGGVITMPCTTSSLARWRRVVKSSATLAYASASQAGLGLLEHITDENDGAATIRTWSAPGTKMVTASAAVTVGSYLYGAANGKVAASGSVPLNLVAMQAAAADGDVIEAMPVPAAPGGLLVVTADATLTQDQNGARISNYGASGTVVVTLPAAPQLGTTYHFAVGAAQALRIDPDGTDLLIANGAAQAAGKYIWADDEAETITLTYIDTGKWLASGTVGTWTMEA